MIPTVLVLTIIVVLVLIIANKLNASMLEDLPLRHKLILRLSWIVISVAIFYGAMVLWCFKQFVQGGN